jgi:hypothetical protein
MVSHLLLSQNGMKKPDPQGGSGAPWHEHVSSSLISKAARSRRPQGGFRSANKAAAPTLSSSLSNPCPSPSKKKDSPSASCSGAAPPLHDAARGCNTFAASSSICASGLRGAHKASSSASTPRALHASRCVTRCSHKASPASLGRAVAAAAAVPSCTRRLIALDIARICACIAISKAVSLDLAAPVVPSFTGGRPAPAGATPFNGGRPTPAGTPAITGGLRKHVISCAPPAALLAATRGNCVMGFDLKPL